MFRFGSREGTPVYGALFDISSGSIGIAIVESRSDRTLPTLIYSNRLTVRSGANEQDIRRIKEALLSASLILSQEGQNALRAHNARARISRLLVTCGSPWSHTVARNVSYESDEPFKITKNLLHDLAESAEQEILADIRADENGLPAHFEIVERATTDIAVNDYVIADPLSKTGMQCSLSHAVGLVPREIIDAIDEVQSKLFPETELKVHTYMLALYCVLRDAYPRTHAFTIADVTSEATEFAIVENNLLVSNICIMHGTGTFVRGVMEATGRPAADIETMIAAAARSHVQQGTELEQQIDIYAKSVGSALEELRTARTIPAHTVITARAPYTQLFGDTVRNALLTATETEPIILDLDHNLLYEVTPGLMHDTHTALNARFFHKLHGCGELDAA